jgi:hypothetical protein
MMMKQLNYEDVVFFLLFLTICNQSQYQCKSFTIFCSSFKFSFLFHLIILLYMYICVQIIKSKRKFN